MADECGAVVEIARRGGAPKRRSLCLEGEHVRWVSTDVLRELGVRSGDRADTRELLSRIEELEPRIARNRALRLLSARERTVAELEGRLCEDGYPDRLVKETVAALLSSGFVDDERYASLTARALVECRGLGRSRALRELTSRGVDEALALQALDQVAPVELESDRALDLGRRLARPADTVTRLAARLVRRGFPPSAAFTAARNVLPDDPRDDAPQDG